MAKQTKEKSRPKPLVLLIVEGWGIAPAHPGNAITEARPDFFYHLLNCYPALALSAAGAELGVNTASGEAGHRLIGGGRPLISPPRAVDEAIAHPTFSKLPVLRAVFKKGEQRRLHLVGLLSQSDNDASMAHLEALITAARNLKIDRIFLHCILDGVDSPERSGHELVTRAETLLGGNGRIASLTGRFYGLDIYGQASRLTKATAAIARTEGINFTSVEEAFTVTYDKAIFDSEFPPCVIKGEGDDDATIKDGDAVIFWNAHPLSIRPLAACLSSDVPTAHYFSLSDYHLENISPLTARATENSTLGSLISAAGYRQLRVSDSEGFAGATTWLNGLIEMPFPDEDRRLIATPLRENSNEASTVTDEQIGREVVRAIESATEDFIVATFSSLDRTAHGRDLGSAIAVVRSLDAIMKRIVNAAIEVGAVVAITASHGIAEHTVKPNDVSNATHASSLVPFLLVGREYEGYSLGRPQPIDGDLSLVPPSGSLIDVAPTLLELMHLAIPTDMRGHSLITPIT